MQLTGIHHLTAITADAPANKRFYTETLGLRLVKKTVNQDDTSAYHLFYADGEATPGTDLTFFDWPVSPERRGTHSISRTGLRVAGEASIDHWAARLKDAGVTTEAIKTIDETSRQRFKETFDIVNDKFQQVFPRLFGGGRASLVLTNEGGNPYMTPRFYPEP